jgi:hypothetical protein
VPDLGYAVANAQGRAVIVGGDVGNLHFEIGDQTIAVTLGADVPVGERLNLTAPPTALHFFDPETGRRLEV